mmetsp:Transcript_67078/g.155683  ORF Transcript_67078/g.155683 Transcript_67078/m.155683 type:complete len:245 (+) Transcript_67078:448-1182(+)
MVGRCAGPPLCWLYRAALAGLLPGSLYVPAETSALGRATHTTRRRVSSQYIHDVTPNEDQIVQARQDAILVVAWLPRFPVRNFKAIRQRFRFAEVYPEDASLAIGVGDEQHTRANALMALDKGRILEGRVHCEEHVKYPLCQFNCVYTIGLSPIIVCCNLHKSAELVASLAPLAKPGELIAQLLLSPLVSCNPIDAEAQCPNGGAHIAQVHPSQLCDPLVQPVVLSHLGWKQLEHSLIKIRSKL